MVDSLLSAFTGIFSAVPPAAWIVTTFAGIGLGALSALFDARR